VNWKGKVVEQLKDIVIEKFVSIPKQHGNDSDQTD